jgi:amino acid permease
MGNNTSTKSTLSQDNDVSKRKKAGIDRKHFRVIDAERSESLTPAAATANPNSLDDTSEPVLIPNQISVEALNKCRHQRDESNLLSPRHLHMIALAGAIVSGSILQPSRLIRIRVQDFSSALVELFKQGALSGHSLDMD